jgi:hypothetical protein
LGLLTYVQAVPFQCKISVSVAVPVRFQYHPTAQASLPDTALTPMSSASLKLGLGLLTFDQAVPFQCKISVLNTPVLFWRPTAQASLPDTALTPNSTGVELRATPAGAWLVAGTAAAAPVAPIPPRPTASTPTTTRMTTRLLAHPIAPSLLHVTRGTASVSPVHPAIDTRQLPGT